MKVNEVYLQKLHHDIRDKVRDYIKSNDSDQYDLIDLVELSYDMGYSNGYFDCEDD